MKQFNLLAAFALIIFIAPSCSKQLLGVEKPNTQTENFHVLWQDFDEHYGSFEPKGINWQQAYEQFSPLISDTMSDLSFFTVCKNMLDVLDDNHVYLRPLKGTGLPWYAGGILGRTKVEDYDQAVAHSYLSSHELYSNLAEYGLFAGNIGYINLLKFDENISVYYKMMDVILDKLKETQGIVIEMRQNDGGEDRVAQYVANRFASETNLSFTVRLRNGPKHSDFSDPIEFVTKPEGAFQYVKPVVVLTNLNTFSSGETFVLAMMQNRQVKFVGDVTGGALSDAPHRELPNGWLFRMPIADVRNPAGKNLEGIGIQPTIRIKNTKEELAAGHDKAMEKALEVLSH